MIKEHKNNTESGLIRGIILVVIALLALQYGLGVDVYSHAKIVWQYLLELYTKIAAKFSS